MPSVLRRYDDDSAPGLMGNAQGSLISVLKKVLVDRYGSLPGLGWTVEFEDVGTHRVVFRPGGNGIRPHVLIDDNDSTGRYARVIVYESMTDINTGIGPCPSLGVEGCIYKAYGDYPYNMPWVIIGDELGFWMLIRAMDNSTQNDPDNGTLYWPHYIGEWTCYHPGNNYNFVVHLQSLTGIVYFTGDNALNYLLRNPKTIERGSVYCPLDLRYVSYDAPGFWTYAKQATVGGRYFYEPVNMYFDEDPTVGKMPGFLSMIWKRENSNIMNATERQEFYDVTGDNKIFVFAQRIRSYAYNSVVGRGAVIVGGGFRNAY